MIALAIILVALLAWSGFGAWLLAPFRSARSERPVPVLEQVRDEQLDIGPALERGRR